MVRVRLDAKHDRPWLRQNFKHQNLRKWSRDHRADLVFAALVLCRFWFQQGSSRTTTPSLGMFESWSAVIGGILKCAGIKGFLQNLAELYEESDYEGGIWRAFVAGWWRKFQGQSVGVSQLLELAQNSDHPLDLAGGELSQKISLGMQLTRNKDRQFRITDSLELRITAVGKKQGAQQWRLEQINP